MREKREYLNLLTNRTEYTDTNKSEVDKLLGLINFRWYVRVFWGMGLGKIIWNTEWEWSNYYKYSEKLGKSSVPKAKVMMDLMEETLIDFLKNYTGEKKGTKRDKMETFETNHIFSKLLAVRKKNDASKMGLAIVSFSSSLLVSSSILAPPSTFPLSSFFFFFFF